MGIIVPTYEYYTSKGGSLSEAEFNLLLDKAVYCLDEATFGKYSKLTEQNTPQDVAVRLRDCLCAIVDYLSTVIDSNTINYRQELSERVGNWSVTYSSTGIAPNYIYYIRTNIVGLYLDVTNLTCRWV
jgi:hypothetical protein